MGNRVEHREVGYIGDINGYQLHLYDHILYKKESQYAFHISGVADIHTTECIAMLCEIADNFGISYKTTTNLNFLLEFDDRNFYNFLILALQNSSKKRMWLRF